MDSSVRKEEIAADPFAEDIFADSKQPGEVAVIEAVPAQRAKDETPRLWIKKLPKVSLAEADWDELFRNLPSEFFDEIPGDLAETLTRNLVLPQDKKIAFLFLVKREIRRAEELPAENQYFRWLTVGIEGSDAEIAFEIDDSFSAWLVDAALGSRKNADGTDLRKLTPSELAVVEFLTLSLVGEANRNLQSPLFVFRALDRKIPDWLEHSFDGKNSAVSLLRFNYQTVHNLLPSIVKMYLAPEALRALQIKENSSQVKHSVRTASKSLQKQIKNLRTRLSLGSAELGFAEIAAVEPGDVVLLENHELFIRGETLTGQVEILFGDGENAKISGELVNADIDLFPEAVGQNGAGGDNKIPIRQINLKRGAQISIENFLAEENRAESEKLMTETDEKPIDESAGENPEEQTADESGLAVENLSVILRVELDARRLTLTEIGNLRENQILELGIRPTDQVNLLIDNQTIGRGELVAVGEDDRLGVRITKLLR